jgi:hypothetical protein
MRSLSIQVQPDRSPGIDIQRLSQEFLAISELTSLVKHHAFNSGNDNGIYFNFTFGTTNAQALWSVILQRLYGAADFEAHMSRASMAMCSGESGWETYVQLFHYDPTVPVDRNAL